MPLSADSAQPGRLAKAAPPILPAPPVPPAPLNLRDVLFLGAFALAKLVAHLVSVLFIRYGWFGDELYYLDCARHLAWGYVDHPPLAMALLALWTGVFGDGLLAVRLPAYLLGAGTVFTAGLITRELGGRRFAQGLTCLAVLIAGVYLATDSFYSMNAPDKLFWALAIYLVVRIVRRDQPRLWLLFGVVAGLGLLNKYSMGFLGLGLGAGMLLTAQRRQLRSPYLWGGAGIAVLIFLPHLIWEMVHGWPSIEFMHNAMAYKIVGLPLPQFLLGQVLEGHPANLLLWLGGLVVGLLARDGGLRARDDGRPLRDSGLGRMLSLSFLAIFLLLALSGAKVYYLAPAFLLVLPPGAVWFEGLTESHRHWRAVLPAVMVVTGLLVAPMAMPLLRPATYLRYQAALGFGPPVEEHGAQGAFPQHLGWRFGWPELVEEVARVYDALPPEQRARCGIFSDGYGGAGAINRLGRDYGLPRAICGQNSHWLWGPRDCDGSVMIVCTSSGAREWLGRIFASVEEQGRLRHPYVPAYANDRVIFLCRDAREPLADLWPQLKVYQ
jgi:hypothetical protein